VVDAYFAWHRVKRASPLGADQWLARRGPKPTIEPLGRQTTTAMGMMLAIAVVMVCYSC
jgi:hypothetical protein